MKEAPYKKQVDLTDDREMEFSPKFNKIDIRKMTITAQRDTINMGDWETDLELKSAELREFKKTKRWADKRPVSYNIASSKLLLKKQEQ